jgi:hypothetical protein
LSQQNAASSETASRANVFTPAPSAPETADLLFPNITIKRSTSDLHRVSLFAFLLFAFVSPSAQAGQDESDSQRTQTTVTSAGELDEREYRDAVARLEFLRRKLEEWGSVTASAPIIMRESGQFSLDREIAINRTTHELEYPPTQFKSTQQHIEDASTAVSGRATQDTRTSFGNSLNLEVTPLVRFGASNPKMPNGTAGTQTPTTAAGQTPTATSTPDVLPKAPGENELTPPPLVLTDDIKAEAKPASDSSVKPAETLSLTSQQSILLGTNSKITELLMRNMADPHKRDFTNPGKMVHMAIVEVSCNPGWRTRENYVADVNASCEYYNSGTHRVASEMEGRRPVVFSVMPLLDAQTLELQNSQRQITELAAQISAAFPTQAANYRAKDVMKFLKDYRSSVATKTPKTISNSYSSGNIFGFRFMPSLVALKDPAERHSPAANILQSTVLPVLVTIVTDTGWIQDHGFDSVMLQISYRWLLNDRPPLRTFWRRFTRPMQRETAADRSTVADGVQAASETLAIAFGGTEQGQLVSPNAKANDLMLRRDLNELSAKLLGSSHVLFAFPEPKKNFPGHPTVASIEPRTIPADRKTTVAIWGENFLPDATVFIGAWEAEILHLNHQQIIATVTIPSAELPGTSLVAPLIVQSGGGFDTMPDKITIFKPTPAK